jgi:hypothetical protein
VIAKRGKFFHYAFMLDVERYRGSTKETTASKARQFESMLIANIRSRGGNRQLKRSPILAEFAQVEIPSDSSVKAQSGDRRR